VPNINGHFVQKSLSGPRRTLQTDRAIRVTKVVSKFIYHLFIYYARNNIHVHRECRKIIIENKTVKQNEKITNQETRRKKSHPDANAVINVTNRYQLWLRNTILGRTDRISLRHDFANSLSIPRAFQLRKALMMSNDGLQSAPVPLHRANPTVHVHVNAGAMSVCLVNCSRVRAVMPFSGARCRFALSLD